MAGAPMGNNNAGKGRAIRDAFNRALKMHRPVDERDALDAVVKSVLAEAMDGNIIAAKEVFDRVEGKAVTTVDATVSMHEKSIEDLE